MTCKNQILQQHYTSLANSCNSKVSGFYKYLQSTITNAMLIVANYLI